MQGCSEQTALGRQDLSCTYLAHYELGSVLVIIIIVVVVIIIIVVIIIPDLLVADKLTGACKLDNSDKG